MQIMINIAHLDPAAVLWALFNDAKPSPLALRASLTSHMDEHQIVARYEASTRRGDIRYFDAVHERPLKLAFFDMDGVLPEKLDVTAYDAMYGTDAAERAVAALRLDHSMQFRVMMARERIDYLAQQQAESAELQPC